MKQIVSSDKLATYLFLQGYKYQKLNNKYEFYIEEEIFNKLKQDYKVSEIRKIINSYNSLRLNDISIKG